MIWGSTAKFWWFDGFSTHEFLTDVVGLLQVLNLNYVDSVAKNARYSLCISVMVMKYVVL